MTARTDTARRVRTTLRALDGALATDPIDRTRVLELATRLAEAVDALPTDGRFHYLDGAVGTVATEAIAWAVDIDGAGSAEDLYLARRALDLQRQILRQEGVVAPF